MIARKIANRRSTMGIALLLASSLALFAAAPAMAEGPEWRIASTHGPANMPACGTAPGQVCGEYMLLARNIALNTTSDEEANSTTAPYTITDTLPAGVIATGVHTIYPWDCSATGFPTAPGGTVSCTSEEAVPARAASPAIGGATSSTHHGMAGALYIEIAVEPGTEGSGDNLVEVSGGGAAEAAGATDATSFSSAPTPFGLSGLGAGPYDARFPAGAQVTQAGSHPFEARFDLDFNLGFEKEPVAWPVPFTEPAGHVRNAATILPPGFLGNPEAAARCTGTQFNQAAVGVTGGYPKCPPASQVGIVSLLLNNVGALVGGDAPNVSTDMPLYNLAPPRGTVARLGFAVQATPNLIIARLVPSGDPVDPYRVEARLVNAPEILPIRSAHLTLWGVPAASAHNVLRFHASQNGEANDSYNGAAPEHAEAPFLSLPTQCNTPGHTTFGIESWLGDRITAESEPVTQTGCSKLAFEPAVEAKPTTNLADSPSGLDFHLHVQQNEDPEGLATPHLEDAVVTLPGGMTVNPSSADGLGACSEAQIGFEANGAPNGNPVACPEASKIGSVTAKTPVLEEGLHGAVYLAEQGHNPFGSLLALYMTIENPERGVLVKLAGEVKADPSTGQLTASFKQNPQVPVEDLEVHLKEGPRAPLRTPATCGEFTTTTDLTPWSAPQTADAAPSSSFQLSQGPGGGACPQAGGGATNKPSFEAGTQSPVAGAFSPFVFKLSRADGDQQLRSIDTTLPKGLIGKLAGTTYCSDGALASAATKSGRSEQSAPSCPASSEVGSVNVGAGAGSTPLYVGAKAYLSGPYKGAPLSLAIVTPAVAGPFDLGTVVVRAALYVDPETTQVRAVSDQIPQILQGIPLDVRSIALRLDKPSFTLNPTSCDPMRVDGSVTSVFNQVAPLSSPFQVGGCQGLAFKPKLGLRLKGSTKRGENPALRAVLQAMGGKEANIGKVAVTLPRTAFLDQSHIKTICTRVQFAADQCPAKSVYGHATATTPLLEQPLSGPVYLRSSSHNLPDLVLDLHGQLDVVAAGRIDSVKGGIRSTFEAVPDAPLSKVVLNMKGGKYSLIENSGGVCARPQRATVKMDGHNGKVHDFRPAVRNDCPTHKHKQRKKH